MISFIFYLLKKLYFQQRIITRVLSKKMRNLREKSKRTENTRLETRNEDFLKQATVINHSKSSLISNDNASSGVSKSNVLKTCQSFSKTLFKNSLKFKALFYYNFSAIITIRM